MANTIANFLVGVGLDTKEFDKGSRDIDTALSGFRSKAQLAGGALAAAFGAVGVAAIKSGSEADAFMRKVEKFSTAPRFIYNLGNAFQRMGGQADDAISTIAKTEGILDSLRKGDPSALTEAGLAQVDVSQLQTSRNGEELLANLADVISRTSNDERGEFQRRSLAETFGLSDEGLKLLRQGRSELYRAIGDVDRIAENLERAALAGREYQEAMADVNLEFKRIGNTLGAEVLPHFSTLLRDFSGFLSESMPKVKKAADFAMDNKGATASIALGTAMWASLGTGSAIASKLGLKMASGAMRGGSRLGFYGAAAGAMHGAYEYVTEGQEGETAKDIRRKLDKNPNAISEYILSGDTNNPIGNPRSLFNRKEPSARDAIEASEPKKDSRRKDSVVYQDYAPEPHYSDDANLREYANETVPNTWWRNGVADPIEAAQNTPSAQASLANKPKSLIEDLRTAKTVPPPIVIENKLMLNEREIAKTIRKVNAEDNYNAYTEVVTTESR